MNERTRRRAPGVLYAALGMWLGVNAFRAFVSAAAWNLSDALPLDLKGVIALGVHALALLGCVLPALRHERAEQRLAILLALVGLARQMLLANDAVGSLLALVGWVVWVWWFAAFARAQTSEHVLAGAVASGLALQVGMQAAWQGLDLPTARGVIAVACAAAINLVFAWSAPGPALTKAAVDRGTAAWFSIGAVLFLELTLFANAGRIGYISGLGLLPSVLLIQGGLLAGMLLTAVPNRRVVRFLAAAVAIVAAVATPRLAGTGVVLLVLGNASLVLVFAHGAASRVRSTTLALLAGMLVLFVLVFLFYSRYEWPLLWPVAAAAVALTALAGRGSARVPLEYCAVGLAGVLIAAAGLVPRDVSGPAAGRESLHVLTYNIRQGFDAAGMPAMQRIAEVIRRADADVIALQEVGRGWTLVGGADLVAYLKARFPGHALHYVPVNGQLWGVALMTRLPSSDLGGSRFRAGSAAFGYGYAAATVRFGAQAVRFASVHMTAGLEGNGGDTRSTEVTELLNAVGGADNVIIAGDLNAHPDDEPVRRLISAGFADAGATAGIGHLTTWPAQAPNERIDYVFTKGGFRADSAIVGATTAADHRPVWVRLWLR